MHRFKTSRRETLAGALSLSMWGTLPACTPPSLTPDEPVVDWDDEPWSYTPDSLVPRRYNPRPLPLHAPEFSMGWSDEYRAALLVASPSTPSNAMPLLRRWLTRTWLELPAWAKHPRLLQMLKESASLPGPESVHDLANWYPHPGLPLPWDDLTEWTELRLLDGFAAHPLQIAHDGQSIVLAFEWDEVPRAGAYKLPNLAIGWERQRAGWRMAWIDLDHVRVRRSSGAEWHHALFVARSVGLVAGQTDVHLSRCHLMVESVALLLEVHGKHAALDRIRRLLRPFLQDVSGINRLGDALILGPAGVLTRGTGLGVEGLSHRLQQHLAQVDWKGFSPRGPTHPILGGSYRYGQAAQVFWEGIGRFVDEALATEVRGEVEALGRALAAHNHHPSTPNAHRARPRPGFSWVWPGEVATTAPSRGHWSIPTCLPDVRALCRFVIYHATFAHSWTNDRGWTDGGSLRHAVFGLKHLAPPNQWDQSGFEAWWPTAIPHLDDAIPQVAVGWVLENARWGLFGDPTQTEASETVDKGPDAATVQALIRHIPSRALTERGLPPIAQWRVRINT